MRVNGPGTPFQLLFSDDSNNELSLHEDFRAVLDGDWHIPAYPDKPYVYSNFATARDGRVSYNEPGISTGGDVTGFNAHDRWLMGLLRARADCVLMGDGTLEIERDHLWTAQHIAPDDAEAFTALRAHEGLAAYPPIVFVSYEAKFDASCGVFCDSNMHIVIATTRHGAERARALKCAAKVDVIAFDGEAVDLRRLTQMLHSDYGSRRLLCEGGPRVMGGMLAAGLVDEEFVTLCPSIIGRSPDRPRPSYVEGVAFGPANAPRSKPFSLRRAGDMLFLQTKCVYRT